MVVLEIETVVDAPRETVFDLARSVDAHTETMAGHDERAVDGVTTGTLGEGDQVTWRATHFGIPLELTAQITDLDRPTYFRDEQVDGPFALLVHDHHFESLPDERTRMRDVFEYRSPLGPLGRLADRTVLRWYLRRLLTSRNRELKRLAESRD